MVVKVDVAGKDLRTADSVMRDRENREKWIGVLAWIIVMILATVFGFWLGAISKYGF